MESGDRQAARRAVQVVFSRWEQHSPGSGSGPPETGKDVECMRPSLAEVSFLLRDLPQNWWAVGLRGLLSLLFGILALAWPGLTVAVLVSLFGVYAIADGVLAVYAAFCSGAQQRGRLALEGAIGVIAGVAAFAWPGVTGLALLFVIAAWATLTGILRLLVGIRLRRAIRDEWGIILGGILSVVVGEILLAEPGAGMLAFVGLVGLYAITFGVVLLMLSWRLRAIHQGIRQVLSSTRLQVKRV